jgi:hypothetical protein
MVFRTVVAVALACLPLASATAYYFSSSAGSDANTGTSAAAPLEHLNRSLYLRLLPGDQLLLLRGDVFVDESLELAFPNGVTVASYGNVSLARPEISHSRLAQRAYSTCVAVNDGDNMLISELHLSGYSGSPGPGLVGRDLRVTRSPPLPRGCHAQLCLRHPHRDHWRHTAQQHHHCGYDREAAKGVIVVVDARHQPTSVCVCVCVCVVRRGWVDNFFNEIWTPLQAYSAANPAWGTAISVDSIRGSNISNLTVRNNFAIRIDTFYSSGVYTNGLLMDSNTVSHCNGEVNARGRAGARVAVCVREGGGGGASPCTSAGAARSRSARPAGRALVGNDCCRAPPFLAFSWPGNCVSINGGNNMIMTNSVFARDWPVSRAA